MNNKGVVIIACYAAFVFIIVLIIIMAAARMRYKKNCYKRLRLGMSEEEMLAIMKGHYNKSYLKDNRIKCEWRYNNGMSGSIKGLRFYSGVSKCTVYLKNGVIEEIRPFNC